MRDDLFSDSVDKGWNRNQITSDLLNEGDQGVESDDAPPPVQQAQPQQQQPQQQPQQSPRRFVPEGYESPTKLRARRDALVRRYRQIDAKLAKATDTNADRNPYAYVDNNGQAQMDNMAYNDDNRQLNSIKMEIDQINEQLREAQDTAQKGLQSVRQYAKDFYLRHENTISQTLRPVARQAYSRYFNDLASGSHFDDPQNLVPASIEKACSSLLRAAIGDAVLASGSHAGKAKPQGTLEDDVETKQDNDDPYADFPDESRKMIEAFERHEASRGGILADKNRQRQGGNQ